MDLTIKKGVHEFFIGESSSTAVARICFTPGDDNIIVADHTFVDESLRGQNIAKKLLDALVSYAREQGLVIQPVCSYVVKAFERFEEYHDIKFSY
jgi:predicted GNAT family acetyltransferase